MRDKFHKNKAKIALMALQAAFVGMIGALMASAYCLLFDFAQMGAQKANELARGSIWIGIAWFVFLVLAAAAVFAIRKWEPMIGGGGFARVESELNGKTQHNPFSIIAARFLGGAITAFCGLSLGRAGAATQVSAMSGIAAARLFKHDESEHKILLACGAAAGFAAAFHAPIAGVFFAFEFLRRCVPKEGFVPCVCATATAGFAVEYIFQGNKIFEFSPAEQITAAAFGAFVVLGVVLGVFGAFFNKFSAFLPKLYARIKGERAKLVFAFVVAGVFGMFLPQVLGSGQAMSNMIAGGELAVEMLLILLIGKFIFTMICAGSGAPGGIFMPLFGMCSAIGAIMCAICVAAVGISPELLHSFIGLAVAGGFAAVSRAPITGIFLLLETTGDIWNIPSAITVCTIAYIVSILLHKSSIGQQQLEKLHENL